MCKVVYINCDTVPFLDRIISLDKVLETRTRNMLKALVGQTVYLAETRRGRRPVIRCRVTIGTPMAIRTRDEWNRFLALACIPAGSRYDWQNNTTVKHLYPLIDVQECPPHIIPADAEIIRHGRTWSEYRREAQA